MDVQIKENTSSRRTHTVPYWQALSVSAAAVVVMAYLRFWVFPGQTVSISYTIALLIGLWHRDRKLLLGMAIAFSAMALVRIYYFLPGSQTVGSSEIVSAIIMLLNIWIVAVVIYQLLKAKTEVEVKNDILEKANAKLQVSNKELTVREEQIFRQNNDLQSLAGELEQQTEELRRQAEELESQSEELQIVNSQLSRRESALQILFESTRWVSGESRREDAMSQICKAAVEAMEGQAVAAAIVEQRGGELMVRGHCGFGKEGPRNEAYTFQQSLAAIVMERKRTAYIKDIALRPDLSILQPNTQESFSSVLASPLRVNGEIVGALEIFSQVSNEWTAQNFQMIEWLAAQASLLLETMYHQEQIKQRGKEAEEASIRKTRFLAAVSHDVRTPANAISLLADVIKRAASDPTKIERIPQLAVDLKKSSKSLIELVSDVLDLARFDSGRLDLQPQHFDLLELIQAEVHQHRPVSESKGVELVATLPAEHIVLHMDRMKLARILANLIGNAVKFTEKGSVVVVVESVPHQGVKIEIRDSGIGISEEHQKSIFDEFFQLRNPERDRNKGAGLGLAICKRLVDGLDCTMSVTSKVGQGTTFTVHIPEALVSERTKDHGVPKHSKILPNEGTLRLHGLRVLLVEDHDITRRSTAEILELEGAIVIHAESGRSALAALVHEMPEVIVLDLMLPDMDGAEVLNEIAQRRPRSLRSVVVVSGDVTPRRVAEVRERGADHLLSKPIDPEALIEFIAQFRKANPSNVIELRGTHS